METYNYEKLNKLIKDQYKSTIDNSDNSHNYNNLNFLKSLMKSYNNPSIPNLISTTKTIIESDKSKEIKTDNIDDYLYNHLNYI